VAPAGHRREQWDPGLDAAWPHDGDDYRRRPEIFKGAYHLITGAHHMGARPRFCRAQD
jgi:hypothetical protein